MTFKSVSERTFLIAEAGVNHNGSLETAKKLCLEAKSAGASYKISNLITENTVLK